MNLDYVRIAYVVGILILVCLLCKSETGREYFCNCSGLQAHPDVYEKEERMRAISACQIPNYMQGVV